MQRLSIIALAILSIAAAPSKKELARATALVDQAVALFRAERYAGAAELFLEAYEITGVAVQLRNAAKAFGLAGDEDRALDAWRQYGARRDISGSDRAEATAEVARIEEKQRAREAIRAAEEAQKRAEEDAARAREEAAAARAKAATATAATARAERDDGTPATGERNATPLLEPSPPGQPRLTPSTTTDTDRAVTEERSSGPYYLAGGSAAVLLAGAIVFVHSSSRLSALDQALETTDVYGRTIGVARATATEDLASINRERNTAAVILGTGAAVLAVSAVWWLIDR